MHRSAPAAGPPYPPIATRWPVLATCPDALTWLRIQGDLGLAPRTIEAYARGLAEYLAICQRDGINPQQAGRADGSQRGLVPRLSKLPWIPTDAQWHQLLLTARTEPLRNRLMLALAYDAGLRREELCSLRTDDLDPAYRMLRVRAETTKG